MAQIEHLQHAPIREALVDIQTSTDVAANQLNVSIKDFSEGAKVRRGELGFKIANDQSTSVQFDQNVLGYRFESTDSQVVLLFRTDGFTLSWLRPYQDWKTMLDHAKRHWEFYVSLANPENVTRVATRYVNLIQLPPNPRLDEFLTAPPAIPEKLDQQLLSFFTRVELRNDAIHAKGIVTQALSGVHHEYAPVVLDIEVFKTDEFDPATGDIWESLESLRHYKNDIFFESITDKTVRLHR